jgi:hypothetical protein
MVGLVHMDSELTAWDFHKLEPLEKEICGKVSSEEVALSNHGQLNPGVHTVTLP